MVGVAGKSKACNNCKRRRVKCGFERPGCTRCARARIQCSGYGQQTFFVNKTLADLSASAPAVLAKFRLSRLKDPESRSIQDQLNGLVELAKASTAFPSHFRLEAFELLQKLYLPHSEVADNNPSHAAPVTWFRAVCELEDPCLVLDNALIAFCTIQVYVTNTGSVSHDEGTERYNTTLGYLSTALNGKGDARLDYILAAIVVLSTCELFFFPTDNGLRVHVQGIADVLRLKRRFTDVSTTIWLRLWSRLRVISILSQLTGRQQDSVSAAQWADFMPDKSNLDPMDQLMDIVCELPQILDSATKLVLTGQSGDSEITAAVAALWSIMGDLYAWQARLCAASPTPLYTAVPSKLNNPSDDTHDMKLFPFALEFRSLQTATHFVASWAFQLHIHTTLQRLFEERDEARTMASRFFDLHNSFGSIQYEAGKLARLLCQSIEYCHRIEMGTFGPQTMVYPQWIMRQFFTQCGAERELQWCNNVGNMSGIGTRCGIKLMAFQGSINCLKSAREQVSLP
ncbi:uncharacterized protein BDR25DRAFT_271487 [Lindgomyces ingoldianus]|uniref:Uncharacterized protein n=1 Tax=Lindgomyces ingoldianus TaxID=673940 RepID=A0ACB6QE71_9PLEO|nr:uncharacterized protein BDR25DRAFT_271487 [Lindgomyces ingoldianus]KAF2464800.1 hypothetical protein BDR25DRAFT_271487 [Lindgomyces ingoldianus]